MSRDHGLAHAWLDDAALYALGALDGVSLTAFEAHLASCEECATAVREHRETTAFLAYSAPERTPPARLRERILRDARGSGQGEAGLGLHTQPRSTRRLDTRWLAAASIALVAVAAAGYWVEREARSAAERDLVAARTELEDSRAALASRDSALAMLLAPDVRFAALAAADDEPTLRVFWNESRDVIVVSAFNLPSPPSGRTYQLWGIGDAGSPISLGTFDTDATGSAVVLLNQGTDVPDAATLQLAALTLEPEGGSPQPTENPRFVGAWRTAY